MRKGTHNLSYICGNACINLAHPYTKVFAILYRENFAYPRVKHLPYHIGRSLRTPTQTSPILYGKEFAYPHAKYPH